MRGRVTHTATIGGTVPTTAPRPFVATSSVRDDGAHIVVARGSIEGPALAEFGTALDHAVASRSSCVYVDLAGVTHWSLLAQAMVLATARHLARRGRYLVLQSPSAALREEDEPLRVFARVNTEQQPFP
jgi:hypothetical protein